MRVAAAVVSGWTKGLELSAITVDLESSSIVLETGVNESWNYAFFRRTKELRDGKERVGREK